MRSNLSRRMCTGLLAAVMAIALPPLGAAIAQPAEEANQQLVSPYPAQVVQRGNLKITVSEIRTVMRGPMFPSMLRFDDNSVVISAAAAKEGDETTSIRSEDNGATWKKVPSPLTEGRMADGHQQGACSKLQLADGHALALCYNTTPIPEQSGYYATTRWESDDRGKTVTEPLSDGRLYLPPDQFDPKAAQWFHGNMIALSNGTLVAVMQGRETPKGPFRAFCAKSEDRGVNWTFLSMVGSLSNIQDPEKRTERGWQRHGPCEPTVVCTGGGRLACMMRLVDDDATAPKAAPMETYRDLAYTVSGDEIYPGTAFPAEMYFTPGPTSVPLVIAFSEDSGATWTAPVPMTQARGCFPQTAVSGDLLALTYGALGYPRWGNCIAFSRDGGKTWADEINFAPFFTTGYTGIATTGPGKFLVVFDAAPPQPWTRHAAHWIGVADISVAAAE